MSKPVLYLHTFNLRLSNRQWIGAVTLTFLSWLSLGGAGIAQDVQHTQNTADQSLRSDLQVDPSTLGMSIGIPLRDYPGRGVNLPITLRYSSKVWRIETNFGWQSTLTYITESQARYAEHSAAGWTVSLEAPRLEPIGNIQPYLNDGSGKPGCNTCVPEPVGPEGYVYINRILMHMPDGSTHELRKDDKVVNSVGLSGIYHAVDGSRLKYDADAGTLYLADGSRYLLNAPGGARFIDSHGNTLSYNSTSKQWTDTLGRVIALPPLDDTAAGDYSYQLPGVGGASPTYIFRWRRLRDNATGQTMLTNPNDPSDPDPYNPGTGVNPLKYPGDRNCMGQFSSPISPSLFNSSGTKRVCSVQELFNPVVLYQIALPQGSAYTFTYNIYGEIDKVRFPTGEYQRYEYQAIDSISSSLGDAFPYGQGNRGVVKHWVSSDGAAADEKLSQYTAARISNTTYKTTVQGPDGARSERYMHASDPLPVEYGFDDARNGRAYDERVYSEAGQMLRRTLTEWTVTGPVGAGAEPSATRDARVTKQVVIRLDTSGDALAQTTTTAYDAALNPITTNSYAFVPVSQTTAQTGAIGAMPTGALLRTMESTFLVSDPAITGPYQQRHLLSLPTMTRVKDGAGTIVSETQYKYDEAAYPLLTYGVTPPGWTDPATNHRGLVTTTRRWLNHPNGTYLESHAQYDQMGNVRKTWDAKGQLPRIQYDDSFSDGGNRNSFAYPRKTISPIPDPSGASGADASLETISVYDYSTGKAFSTTDANDQQTVYQYESGSSLNRLTKVTRPDGGETSYQYGDTPGSIYIRTLTKQDATTTLDDYVYFDGIGRPWRSGHYEGANSWSVTDTLYDEVNREQKVSNPYSAADLSGALNPSGVWTTTRQDELGRVISVRTPDGAVVTTAYDGNRVTVTDQAGKKRRSVTDAFGRLVSVTEAPGELDYETAYLYDALGNLRKVTQGAQKRWFAYDSLSRLIRVKNPEQNTNSGLPPHTDPVTGGSGWSMAYSYDANGNLVTKIDARNIMTNYTYDALNRNTSVDYSNTTALNPDITRVYDNADPGSNGRGRLWLNYARGNFSNGTDTDHTVIDSYDALGRPLSVRQHFKVNGVWKPGVSVGYTTSVTYDLAGNVKTMTYPSGRTVNYSFGGAGRLSSFTGNLGDGRLRTYSAITQYHPAGMIERETFGTQTPLRHKKRYNNRLQLGDLRLSAGSDALSYDRGALHFYYGPNAVASNDPFANDPANNGNLVKQAHYVPIAGGGEAVPQADNYTYDALNRISGVVEPNVFTQTFGYDQWGNRRITSATGGVNNYNPTYDQGSNRIVGLSYDQAGNITSDLLTGGAMTYDAENRLLTATAGGGGIYTYDASGKRTRRTAGGQETWYVYGIEGELLAEYAADGAPSATRKEYGYRGGQLLSRWSEVLSQIIPFALA